MFSSESWFEKPLTLTELEHFTIEYSRYLWDGHTASAVASAVADPVRPFRKATDRNVHPAFPIHGFLRCSNGSPHDEYNNKAAFRENAALFVVAIVRVSDPMDWQPT